MRGTQAGREYYVSICELNLIPKLFLFDEENLPANLRAQRRLNQARIPEIARYINDNQDSYVFSALTASVDGPMEFRPLPESDDDSAIGYLHIPMSASFVINDGQHRRAAIELALHEDPTLAHETIAVVFFSDPGLAKSQQMFADLNRYAVKPSRSLSILYDSRDDLSELVRKLVFDSDALRGLVDLERTNLSVRSGKLFTLSSIYTATRALLNQLENVDIDDLALEFWDSIAAQFPQWKMVQSGKLTAGEVRQEYIHPHSIILSAICTVGNFLFRNSYGDWTERVSHLREIDWSRHNSALWEGMVLQGGRIVKSRRTLKRTVCFLKQTMEIPLSDSESEFLHSELELHNG